MQIKDKQYYIYIRSSRQRVYVTKEQFEDYYREINAFRMKQKRHKRCSCPKSRILDCDMDCGNCPYAVLGDTDSLNDVIVDKDGNEIEVVNTLVDPSPLIEDLVPEMMELEQLFKRINELMPEAVHIGKLRQKGFSEREIESKLGVGRKTYAYRLNKLKSVLEKEFPEFF